MLHEFISLYRDAIIARTREKLTDRPWPLASTSELEHGVPLFLTQLSDTLRLETTATPFSQKTLGASAANHGRELRALGFNISQVVHDYGDICQAITEVSVERHLPITTEEFHTLNRCLDTAIAEAVTEHARITAESRSTEEIERTGQLAHEIRDRLNTALLAFHTLKQGTVAINGSTGAVLGRSLVGLRDLVDNTLSDIRMAANIQCRERVAVADFLNEIAIAGNLHADSRGVQLSIERADVRLAVNADPQLLASAVMSLLNNAFKYTPAGGHVALRAPYENGRVRFEVEDECGGIAEGTTDPFKAFAERRHKDINVRNLPGKGCIFAIEMPLAGENTPGTPSVG
jgi:signal transduction histidine kinase